MKFFTTILLMVFATVASYGFSVKDLTLTKGVKEFKLKNGLRLLVKEENSIPIVGFGVFYQVGFANDITGNTGLSHLLEHMLFQGTKKHKKGEFNKILTDFGARFNAFTTYESTVYWEILPRAGLETAINLEADRMENALLDETDFQREKNVVLSELSLHESNPSTRLQKKVLGEALGLHPFAARYGVLSDMSNANRNFVYEKIYKKYYVPNNAYAIVVGNVKAEEALAMVEKAFGKIAPNPALEKESIKPYPISTNVNIVIEGAASEDFGYLYFNLPRSDWNNRDHIVLSFIQNTGILGEFSHYATKDGGLGIMEYSKDPDFPAETVDTNYIIKNFTIFRDQFFESEKLSYDSIQDILFELGYLERNGGINLYNKIIQGFMSVTPDEVISTIKKYLNRNNSFRGFFKAVKKDKHARPENMSQTRDDFSQGTDYSELDNPTEAQLTSAREALGKIVRDAASTISNYLTTVRETRLDNGITIVYRPFTLNSKISVVAGLKAGSVYQTRPETAAYTYSMVFDGGPQILVRNELEKQGAGFKGSQDTRGVQYQTIAASEHFDEIIDMLAKALINRKFSDLILEEKKFNSILELEKRKNNPSPELQAGEALSRMLYGNSGEGLDISAEKKDLIGITMKDIQDFYETCYRPENMVITIVGNLDFDKVVSAVNSKLGSWKQPQAPLRLNEAPLIAVKENKTEKIEVPSLQSIVLMGAPSVSYLDATNYTAFMLANEVFGGSGLSSRLMRLIRDKEGLTYGVYTYPKVYGTQTMFRLYMQNANNDVPKALDLFRRELAEYKKNGPNEMELIKAKGSILNSLLFDYENADKTSTTLLYHKLYRGDASYYKTFVELLSGLDRNKILETIRTYFPEYYFTAIAGD